MKKIKALVAAAVLVASTSSFAAPVFADTITNTDNTIAIEDTIILQDTTETSEVDNKKIDITKLETKDPVEAKDGKGYRLVFDYDFNQNDFAIKNMYSDISGKFLVDYFKELKEEGVLVMDSGDNSRPKIEAELVFDSGLSSKFKLTYFVIEKEPGLFGKHYIQPYTMELNKEKKEGIDNQVPAYNVNLSDRAAMERMKNQLGDAVQNQGCKLKHDNKAVNGVYVVTVTKYDDTINKDVTLYKVNFYEETVSYSTHVQNIGWQNTKTNGTMSGTEGQALRLEGIKLDLGNMPEGSSIEYRTHVENLGWQDWKSNGEVSGTEGEALRLEGIEIKLSDDLAKYYDVEYRTHVENYGWQDWVKNGEMSGTEGEALRLEGIEVRLVSKIAH